MSDEFGSLPESERRRISESIGGKFIGDGPIPPRDDPSKVRWVRERDGSYWVNVDELAAWIEYHDAGSGYYDALLRRLREARDKAQADVDRAVASVDAGE